MSMNDLINTCLSLKKGNKEFILSCDSRGGEWEAGIGNPSSHVSLGESSPEIAAEADNPESAVKALIALLVARNGEAPEQ